MSDLAEARRLALALPEVTEQPHFDMASFRVRGKIFVTVPAAASPGAGDRRVLHGEIGPGDEMHGVDVR
jgi:hypothetical protein